MTNGPQTVDLERHLSANPSSPVFARLAEALLRNGEVSRADRLCEKGLESHPEYTTGRLIHARCLAARGLYAKALESLGSVAGRYPGNILLGEIDDEWRSLMADAPGRSDQEVAVFTDLPPDAPGAGAAPPDAVPPRIAGTVPAVETPRVAVMPRIVEAPADRGAPPSQQAGPAADTRPADAARPAQPAQSAQPTPPVHSIQSGQPGQPGQTGQTGTAQPRAEILRVTETPIDTLPPADPTPPEIGDALNAPGVAVSEATDGPGTASATLREPDDLLVPPPMPVPSPHAPPVPILQPVPRTWKGPGFIEAGRIVSRTLAEIYAAQGAIGEAVETYRILLNRMPEMREELEPRLRQLEERLRSDQGPRHSPGNTKAPA